MGHLIAWSCEDGQSTESSVQWRPLSLVLEAAVWLKLGWSPSRVEEVVGELLHHGVVYLRMEETKRAGGALACRHPVPDWH